MARWPALLLALAVSAAAAQSPQPANGVLLVAKPGLPDPRFAETVVLVTQAPEGQTVGVILNRPLRAKLAELVQDESLLHHYKGTVYFGGPVMERSIVALFRSSEPPRAPAFHVLKGIYLSMHPGIVEPLLRESGAGYRIYAGFSGWAARQLEGEIERDGWYVLPASEQLVFRSDTAGMWEELLARVHGKRAALY
jgi:putative transcriptional regulator